MESKKNPTLCRIFFGEEEQKREDETSLEFILFLGRILKMERLFGKCPSNPKYSEKFSSVLKTVVDRFNAQTMKKPFVRPTIDYEKISSFFLRCQNVECDGGDEDNFHIFKIE